jgi:sec-independent protein translocase protein TatA
VFALILESLGSTELLLILAVALIFFGPRKLPQLARSMGKGLSEFRKASDDFKRTWEREVALETATVEDNSLLEVEQPVQYEANQSFDEPTVETPDPDLVVLREDTAEATSGTVLPEAQEEAMSEVAEIAAENAQPEPVRKQDWL